MYRDIGVLYIRGSVADSSQLNYVSSFRSWIKFRGLTNAVLYFSGDTPVSDMVWALVDFAAWCCAAEGNQVGTIKSKIAIAILSSRRGRHGAPDQITTAGTRVQRDISGSCSSWYESRVRRPVSWDMLLEGETLVPSWGRGGRILWLCLALGHFL